MPLNWKMDGEIVVQEETIQSEVSQSQKRETHSYMDFKYRAKGYEPTVHTTRKDGKQSGH